MRIDIPTFDKNAAALAIGTDQLPAQLTIDQAIAAQAQLISTTCTSRIEASLPLELLQPALEDLGEAFSLMIQARGKSCRAHRKFIVAAGRMQVAETAVGNMPSCPDYFFTSGSASAAAVTSTPENARA